MFEVETPGGGIRLTALGTCSNLRGGTGKNCYRLWVSMGGMWSLVAEGDADLPSQEGGYGPLPFPAGGIVVPGGGGRVGICVECPGAGRAPPRPTVTSLFARGLSAQSAVCDLCFVQNLGWDSGATCMAFAGGTWWRRPLA